MARDKILIKGAREHNLKAVDLELPRDQLVVLTGVSGSGKSSLAFDTLYAEGQRRYVESLSAYARQFLGQMEKPKVDLIEGLSPAIAIEQKSASKNPRSTVGTVTEVYDYLRLLFARVGTQHCHQCGQPVASQSAEQMVNRVLDLPSGTRFLLLAPLVAQRKGEYKDIFAEAKAEGFVRVRVDGEIRTLDEEIRLNKKVKHTIEVVVDRLVMPDPEAATPAPAPVSATIGVAQAAAGSDYEAFVTRLTDSIEQALRVGEGSVIVSVQAHSAASISTDFVQAPPEEWLMSESNTCPNCGISFPELTPQMFSFNSPQGACPSCTGLGTRLEVDPTLLVPNGALSLNQGAVTYWGELRKKTDAWSYKTIVGLSSHYAFSLDTPWDELTERQREVIIFGSGKEKVRFSWSSENGSRGEFYRPWEGVAAEIRRRFMQTGSDMAREYYLQYMSEQPCPECQGARLRPESRAVRVVGTTITEVGGKNIHEAHAWVLHIAGRTEQPAPDEESTLLNPTQLQIVDDVLKEIRERLGFLLNVGLHYLSLGRPAPTLSGGEAQRIRLASQIGSGLVGVMYILDEPSIGLHQRDNRKLLDSLLRLRDLGNTLIVVEHDLETMQAADWIVDFGPGAGVKGGEVVVSGPPAVIAAHPDSLTGHYLSGQLEIAIPATRRSPLLTSTIARRLDKTAASLPQRRGKAAQRIAETSPLEGEEAWLSLEGATLNNLRDVSVRFPLGTFIAVTGVSGSGKSSLITETLYPALANRLNKAQLKPGPYAALNGLEHLDKVIDIDQQPIGRTPRSNPATYVKLFDLLRDLFANTPEARLRGYAAGRFSFNVKGGRCETCEGNGEIKIDMQFLADVWVRCNECKGKRYNRETMQVKYKGKSIADVLEMDVQTALEFFDNVPRVRRILQTLHDVGLDYVRLGQPATTLSGGEAQRVKLAKELARVATGRTIYILDEPTTGLHFADVQHLLDVLHRLVDAGNTVIVIEHNLDVIKTADWVIDMGPEGGDGGGYVVATGTPEHVAEVEGSHTGHFLREVLHLAGHRAAAD
ncbi:excinuclease ABC subunit UvrA [Candidatus Chloroploca sp. M-50]|uniref:UvrABC system protein A n=1 Tax=Candidatus Chloroploca mongolica TaxID=2528176 RepID=A0ABS4DAC8_9CHLR|nr:excinuclease ABC subunit UvrA [Candidatus Chloroploca mongolica]MBP1466391.1 excinuclease ABC subunit UvrA [Candidatus Chloroploca mongolica]